MRIPQIPETDLARVVSLPSELRKPALKQLRFARPPYTYAPTRNMILDILDAEAGPLASVARAPWKRLSERFDHCNLDEKGKLANRSVAKGLYDFATERGVFGDREKFGRLVLAGENVKYWSDVSFTLDNSLVVPFFDFRRLLRLTPGAMRFVFSVMHERIRALDPEFEKCRLAIVQFSLVAGDSPRVPEFHFDDTLRPFPHDVLVSMVCEAYELWREVLQERANDARSGVAPRKATPEEKEGQLVFGWS